MAEVFIAANDVKALTSQVIASREDFSHINVDEVLFLSSDGSQKKIAYVRGLRGDVGMLSDKKYILCVMERNYNILSEADKAKVIEHELLHFHPEFDGKLVPHDVLDFREILGKYGVNWVPEAMAGVVDRQL